MLEVRLKNAEDMINFGDIVGRLLKPGNVVCLIGELGSGKTTLVKGISKGMGIIDPVTSPTFTIIKEYTNGLDLYHVDAYRLEDPEEILYLGLDEYISSGGVTVIEWADKVLGFLQPDYVKVYIGQELDEVRKVTIVPVGRQYGYLIEELKKYEGAGT